MPRKRWKNCHPRLRKGRSVLQDLSRAGSRFSRGAVAGNHPQHFFDPNWVQSSIGSKETLLSIRSGIATQWDRKSADDDLLQLGPWRIRKQLWILDRSWRKLQVILGRGRPISNIFGAKAHANVLKGTSFNGLQIQLDTSWPHPKFRQPRRCRMPCTINNNSIVTCIRSGGTRVSSPDFFFE